VNKHPQKNIAVFLALTFALSSVFYYLIISSGSLSTLYGLGLMWCPGVAAIVTQLIFQRSLRGMGWKPGRAKYLLVSYALPLAYTFVVYLIVWLTGLGRFDPTALARSASEANGLPSTPFGVVGTYVVIMVTLGFLINCVAALGEEIGWRRREEVAAAADTQPPRTTELVPAP
jgi:uncharacterized protein